MKAKLTRSEEDHLKAVISLEEAGEQAFTNALADRLQTRASSVTSMVRKLADKGLLSHKPYHGVTLTRKGRSLAVELVRRHRLWETFLVERLGFGWEEVHEVAEQLEHVSSEKLIRKLDAYLGHPSSDPHGEPIPGPDGAVKSASLRSLASLRAGARARVAGVNDRSPEFLRFLTSHEIGLGASIRVIQRNEHDGSISIHAAGRTVLLGSSSAANILVSP